jgi:murein DD-endopeptidase MepM/ murein hydrolase activator NlpD
MKVVITRVGASALTMVLAAVGALDVRAQGQVAVRTALFDTIGHPGDVVRLDVTCSCETTGASATVFGRDLPLSRTSNGWQGLIGVDLDVVPGTYQIAVLVEPVGQPPVSASQDLPVVTKDFPVRRLQVAPRYVDPSASELKRIERESALLASIFAQASGPRRWQGAFQAPVGDKPTTGSFGARSVFNGEARSPHSGVDFGARTGTPIAAPAAGIVVLAAPLYFTGNTVVLDHGLGIYSLLAHMSEFNVRKGERVERGQLVGLVGATGRVTAPHLHWSVRLNGARVDPLSLIAVTKE